MHHIYHTEGIILGSNDHGEAGKYYHIFTRELGMVYASAQGVRKMSSKLRYIMQDFAYLKVDLVEGKGVWRVTSASKTGVLLGMQDREAFKAFFNIARLLRRLLPGADPNPDLFSDLVNGLQALENAKKEDDLGNIEAILVLRILHNLGYIGRDKALHSLVRSQWEEGLIYEASQKRSEVLREINKALRETHL